MNLDGNVGPSLFLCGPFPSFSEDVESYEEARRELEGCGYRVVSPAGLCDGFEYDLRGFIGAASPAMLECTGIALLREFDWLGNEDDSKLIGFRGFNYLVRLARKVGMPVAGIDSWERGCGLPEEDSE